MKKIDIERLRKLLTEKTPGTWHVVETPWGDGDWITAGNADPHGGRAVADCRMVDDFDEDTVDHSHADAELVAAAINALPELLAVYEAACGLREALYDRACDRYRDPEVVAVLHAVDAARKAGT